MKNVIIYCSLLILFNACSSATTNEENNSEVNVSIEETDLLVTEDINSTQEVTETVPEMNNCSTSELHVYLDDLDDSGTNIRKSPGGDVITQLVKDDQNVEYFLIITEAQDGWFKIKGPIGGMESDIELPNGEGWVHGSVISVDSRNYGGEQLDLLDHPENGNVVGFIDGESYGLKIKDICGSWVKVECKGVVGWIEDSWLCGNPLTTCS